MDIQAIMIKFFIGSIIIDGIVDIVKSTFSFYFKTKNKHKNTVLKIIGLTISIFMCISYELDLPTALGLQSDHYLLGEIITGLLLSRGSHFIHDISKKMGLSTKVNK